MDERGPWFLWRNCRAERPLSRSEKGESVRQSIAVCLERSAGTVDPQLQPNPKCL